VIYRPEVDGLRSVAVLPVIFFHAGMPLFSGGFVGVDVFFVISGYLITLIISAGVQSGSFSIVDFYERRARRILPALFFVALVCIPFAVFILTPRDLDGFGKSLAAIVVFSSNVLFWREAGYFDTAAELKPMLHTWSLAVEEQFYIFFPLLLMLIWGRGRRCVGFVLGLILALSFVFGWWGSINWPSGAFYLLPARGWELLVGALVALFQDRLRSGISSSLQVSLALIGLGLIAVAVFSYSSQTPVPGPFTAVPVLGAALIILYARDANFVAKVLSWGPLVTIGLISYSAYLWHQPLFAFYKYKRFVEPSHLEMALLTLLVFPLAYLTWRFVETPLRGGAVFKGAVLVRYSLTFSLLLPVGVGIYLMPPFSTDVIDSTADSKQRDQYASGLCDGKSGCLVDQKRVLIVGDSMWQDAVNILYAVRPTLYDVSQIGGCPPHDAIGPLLPVGHPNPSACLEINKKRFSQDFGAYYGVVVVSRYGWFAPEKLDRYLDYLKRNGVERVMVIGPYKGLDTNMDRLMRHYDRGELEAAIERRHLRRGEWPDDSFVALQRRYGFVYVSLRDGICDGDGCPNFVGGHPFTYDTHHLTVPFVKHVADIRRRQILAFFDE
jgi:peptidoglycan/LPS O-acetylase OafA/YrhL